jgi:hypothetical protein
MRFRLALNAGHLPAVAGRVDRAGFLTNFLQTAETVKASPFLITNTFLFFGKNGPTFLVS